MPHPRQQHDSQVVDIASANDSPPYGCFLPFSVLTTFTGDLQDRNSCMEENYVPVSTTTGSPVAGVNEVGLRAHVVNVELIIE